MLHVVGGSGVGVGGAGEKLVNHARMLTRMKPPSRGELAVTEQRASALDDRSVAALHEPVLVV